MDINVNVIISAAPSLIEALHFFANTLALTKTVAAPSGAAQPDEPKRTRGSRNAEKHVTPVTQEPELEKAQEATAAISETAAASETTAEPEPTPELEKASEPEPEKDAAPKITLEAVREKLANISRGGKAAQVKQLLKGLGAEKLTDVPEDKYAELLEAAEKL